MAKPRNKLDRERLLRLLSYLPQPTELNVSLKTWRKLLEQAVEDGDIHWLKSILKRDDLSNGDTYIAEAIVELISNARHLEAENKKLRHTLEWVAERCKEASPWEELATFEVNTVIEDTLYTTPKLVS